MSPPSILPPDMSPPGILPAGMSPPGILPAGMSTPGILIPGVSPPSMLHPGCLVGKRPVIGLNDGCHQINPGIPTSKKLMHRVF